MFVCWETSFSSQWTFCPCSFFSFKPCFLCMTVSFKDSPFKLRHDTITCYQSRCLPHPQKTPSHPNLIELHGAGMDNSDWSAVDMIGFTLSTQDDCCHSLQRFNVVADQQQWWVWVSSPDKRLIDFNIHHFFLSHQSFWIYCEMTVK